MKRPVIFAHRGASAYRILESIQGMAMLFAFFFMMPVKHGEAKDERKSGFDGIEHMESR